MREQEKDLVMNDESTQAVNPVFPVATVHAYAEGKISWREIREETGIENFNILLASLAKEGLKLPRASRDRQSNAKIWIHDILTNPGIAA